ncbi:MAG: hypothetical protein K0R54_231 [Clostridiaceae bacterium]|jgi:hypothetical protein|nr:hypothetical protein [Clostridiaceae bacterium]
MFEKTKKILDSMTTEELTDCLIQNGFEFTDNNELDENNDNNLISNSYPICNTKPTCPYCGQVHSTLYIPESCGDGDEFYIKCEDKNCRETFTVDVIFDCEYVDEFPEATYSQCLNANCVMFFNYRQDDEVPTVISPE